MLPRNLYMQTFFLIAIIVILDQGSKIAVRALMTEGQSISIIGEFFTLTYYNNSGVAFSFLSGHRIIVTIVQILAMVLVAVVIFKTKGQRKLYDFSLGLILAGGIGNVIDRLLFGKVTDMISFSIFPPIFNIADIAVTVGCGLLIIDLLLEAFVEKKEG